MIKTKGLSQQINANGLTEFTVYNENNKDESITFAVNSNGEGLWIKDGDDSYTQILGTAQFSMPSSKGQRRNVLVKLFKDYNY